VDDFGFIEPLPTGPGWPASVPEVIAAGPAFRTNYLIDLEDIATPGRRPLAATRLFAPIIDPGQVLFVEASKGPSGGTADRISATQLLTHPPTAPGEAMVILANDHVISEGRIALVLGRPTTRVSRRQARRSIFGFSIICDLLVSPTRRRSEIGILYALGPWVVVADGLARRDFVVRTSASGGPSRTWRLSQRLVASALSWLSESRRFQPGDIIAFGGGPTAALPLQDSVESSQLTVEVEGFGAIRSSVTRS
jgi:hypothetical protein